MIWRPSSRVWETWFLGGSVAWWGGTLWWPLCWLDKTFFWEGSTIKIEDNSQGSRCTNLEPKWPLFCLEKALFWGVDQRSWPSKIDLGIYTYTHTHIYIIYILYKMISILSLPHLCLFWNFWNSRSFSPVWSGAELSAPFWIPWFRERSLTYPWSIPQTSPNPY